MTGLNSNSWLHGVEVAGVYEATKCMQIGVQFVAT